MSPALFEKLTPAQRRVIIRFEQVCRLEQEKIAWKTEQAYRGHIVGFLLWLDRNRARLQQETSEEKVALYLAKRVVHDRVGATTRDQGFAALLFLYGRVLKQDLGEIRKIGYTRRQKHLPVILDRRQVLAVLSEVENSPATPFRLIACLLYACGLRVSEGLQLRIKDVSISESRLIARGTKGRCDLNKGIACSLLLPLQRQIERVRLLWQQDRERGVPVSLPGMDGLRRKYPSIPYNWGWYYLFPQQSLCPNPQAAPHERHLLYRHHQGDWGVQRAVKAAAMKCGVEGVLTPHALRHAFATHLHRRGETVPTIQQQLGHKSIETTMLYVHNHVTQVRSPLDDAVEDHAQTLSLPQAQRPALALPFPVA